VPEVRIGALADAGGVQKLNRLVGRGKAQEWILLGSHVTAAEALAHGLVTSVHPAAELMTAAFELAGRFRLLGPRAVAQSKMAVRMCGDADLTTARNIGLEALAMLIDARGFGRKAWSHSWKSARRGFRRCKQRPQARKLLHPKTDSCWKPLLQKKEQVQGG
jgi:enoyl-CoA hydratase/carnithine racemase